MAISMVTIGTDDLGLFTMNHSNILNCFKLTWKVLGQFNTPVFLWFLFKKTKKQAKKWEFGQS
jgi:hypothetical protein